MVATRSLSEVGEKNWSSSCTEGRGISQEREKVKRCHNNLEETRRDEIYIMWWINLEFQNS